MCCMLGCGRLPAWTPCEGCQKLSKWRLGSPSLVTAAAGFAGVMTMLRRAGRNQSASSASAASVTPEEQVVGRRRPPAAPHSAVRDEPIPRCTETRHGSWRVLTKSSIRQKQSRQRNSACCNLAISVYGRPPVMMGACGCRPERSSSFSGVSSTGATVAFTSRMVFEWFSECVLKAVASVCCRVTDDVHGL